MSLDRDPYYGGEVIFCRTCGRTVLVNEYGPGRSEITREEEDALFYEHAPSCEKEYKEWLAMEGLEDDGSERYAYAYRFYLAGTLDDY
jgi:hypothetical protein